MIERFVVAIVRMIVRSLAITLTVAVALPHVALLVLLVVSIAVGQGIATALGFLFGTALLMLIWYFVHSRSFEVAARLAGRWRAMVFGVWRWQRTVKGLQLDGQDGEKVRPPRIKKVRGS